MFQYASSCNCIQVFLSAEHLRSKSDVGTSDQIPPIKIIILRILQIQPIEQSRLPRKSVRKVHHIPVSKHLGKRERKRYIHRQIRPNALQIRIPKINHHARTAFGAETMRASFGVHAIFFQSRFGVGVEDDVGDFGVDEEITWTMYNCVKYVFVLFLVDEVWYC